MADIWTWGWYSPITWPGYSAADQDNLDSIGNNLPVNPLGYVEFTMRDGNDDGIIYDHDTDDVVPADYSEYVFGPTLTLHPQEIALYTNSTMVIDGTLYTGLAIQVTLFQGGTWGARLMDFSIPPGLHHSDVTAITLGTWNGVEYDGITLAGVDDPFVCFAAGTRIATPTGLRRVETLVPGDMVLTRDDGPQPILWRDCRAVPGVGRNAPYILRAGAFGDHGTLCLSPQHRLLLTLPGLSPGDLADPQTDPGGHAPLTHSPAHAAGGRLAVPDGDIMAGTCLGAIKHLVDPRRPHAIARLSCDQPIAYVHLLLPRHGLIWAEGIWAESLWPGLQAIRRMSPPARARLDRLFPGIVERPSAYGPTARPLALRRDILPVVRSLGAEALITPARLPPSVLATPPAGPVRRAVGSP